VSVVVVAYNNWPDLELAVASALQQTHRPLEVIVVDNASSDATPDEVPRRFGDRVRYVRQENRGDGGAYNTGLRLARGEYLQFLDGDDLLAPTKIEKQVSVLRADPAIDIAYGDIRQFQSAAGPAYWSDRDARDYPDMLAALLDPNGDGAELLVQSSLFRRRVFEDVGEWDETQYVVDQDFWLRAAARRRHFRYSPGALTFYRRHAGQMSANPLAFARGMARVWRKALTYLEDEPYRTMARTYLARLEFGLAMVEPGVPPARALTRLAAARAICPPAIPLGLLAAGPMIVLFPGGRALARSRLLSGVRRWGMRWLGVE